MRNAGILTTAWRLRAGSLLGAVLATALVLGGCQTTTTAGQGGAIMAVEGVPVSVTVGGAQAGQAGTVVAGQGITCVVALDCGAGQGCKFPITYSISYASSPGVVTKVKNIQDFLSAPPLTANAVGGETTVTFTVATKLDSAGKNVKFWVRHPNGNGTADGEFNIVVGR